MPNEPQNAQEICKGCLKAQKRKDKKQQNIASPSLYSNEI